MIKVKGKNIVYSFERYLIFLFLKLNLLIVSTSSSKCFYKDLNLQ